MPAQEYAKLLGLAYKDVQAMKEDNQDWHQWLHHTAQVPIELLEPIHDQLGYR